MQAQLATSKNGERHRVHNHYLKSSLGCGFCSSRIIVTNTKNRHGTIYPYFIGIGRQMKTTDCTLKAVLIEKVEAFVEDEYKRIQVTPDERDELHREVTRLFTSTRRDAARKEEQQRDKMARLLDQRTKLLQAHYADAVPLDLFKSEQTRITRELTAAEAAVEASQSEVQDVTGTLAKALNAFAHCHDSYMRFVPRERRVLNQGFFDKIWLYDDGIAAELARPFDSLVHPDLAELLARPTAAGESPEPAHEDEPGATKLPALRGAGLSKAGLVPPLGLEPRLRRF